MQEMETGFRKSQEGQGLLQVPGLSICSSTVLSPGVPHLTLPPAPPLPAHSDLDWSLPLHPVNPGGAQASTLLIGFYKSLGGNCRIQERVKVKESVIDSLLKHRFSFINMWQSQVCKATKD